MTIGQYQHTNRPIPIIGRLSMHLCFVHLPIPAL